MRRKLDLHTLELCFRGDWLNGRPDITVVPETDVADLFAATARELGLEGERDTYFGLWETGFVYDEASLLDQGALRRGLRLDVNCDAALPIPLRFVFGCVQMVLDRVGTYSLTEIGIVIKTNAVSRADHGSSPPSLTSVAGAERALRRLGSVAECSCVEFTKRGPRQPLGSRTWPLGESTWSLPELGSIATVGTAGLERGTRGQLNEVAIRFL